MTKTVMDLIVAIMANKPDVVGVKTDRYVRTILGRKFFDMMQCAVKWVADDLAAFLADHASLDDDDHAESLPGLAAVKRMQC
jgi:hypothetical protein